MLGLESELPFPPEDICSQQCVQEKWPFAILAIEKQGHSEMELNPSSSHSHLKLLKVHRELLVTHIRNTQCLVDNLLENDYFSVEDAEIVCACPTQPDKVLLAQGLAWAKCQPG